MRKNNWIVLAIAAIASVALLVLWVQLGFNHVDGILDLVVAALWWVVIIATVGAIVWAENRRRVRMRTAFVGDGVLYNAELGLIQVAQGENELTTLQQTLDRLSYEERVAELAERGRPAFRWVVRSKRFEQGGSVWQGEVLSTADPTAAPVGFSDRDELEALICA